MNTPDPPPNEVALAINALGSRARLAAVCGVSRQATMKWAEIPEMHRATVAEAIRRRGAAIRAIGRGVLRTP